MKAAGRIGKRLTKMSGDARLSPSMKHSKLPAKLPTFVCKCAWANTAVNLLVEARDEEEAKERAWGRVARTEGGDSCLRVTVVRRVDA